MKPIKTGTLIAALCITGLSLSLFATADELDGTRGKIYKVDSAEKRFELLTETLMDPQTQEGKTRHTVEWTDQTQFSMVTLQEDFKGIRGPVLTRFEMLNPAQTKAAEQGKPFQIQKATVLTGSTSPPGIANDRRSLVALFTPDPKQARSGTVEIDGRSVRVSLAKRKTEIRILSPASATALDQGFWEATVYGHRADGGFLLTRAEITPLPDPRKLDDPKLPRVLVVGDSISMNYHEAAKSALAGKANYYRVEGNGGPSDRGVSAMELWLGDYTQKGLHWDVIQFNHGLHDLKQPYDEKTKSWGEHQVSIEDYKMNLEKEIAILKKTGATLIWCSTTPVPNSSRGPYARRKGEAAVYNKAAMEVIGNHPEILVNDLHKTVTESMAMNDWRKGSDVHFWSKDLQAVLGNAVADAVTKALELRTSNAK